MAVADDREAEALVRELRAAGFEVAAVVEQQAMGRLATVRLALPDESLGSVIDLLFASSGIESEVVAASELIELLPHFAVNVARIEPLIRHPRGTHSTPRPSRERQPATRAPA